jgi:hypothetical protein
MGDVAVLGAVVPIIAFVDDVAMMGVMIPIIALCIPIVAILSKHRLREIELKARLRGVSQTTQVANQQELAELKNDVKELKELVHEQMIAVDNLVSNQTRLLEGKLTSEQLQNRIGS